MGDESGSSAERKKVTISSSVQVPAAFLLDAPPLPLLLCIFLATFSSFGLSVRVLVGWSYWTVHSIYTIPHLVCVCVFVKFCHVAVNLAVNL